MRKTAAVAVKEIRQAARDPLSLTLLLVLPAALLLLYGFALNFDVRDIATAVEDRDRSPDSRAIVRAFAASGYFRVTADLAPGDDVPSILERRVARAVLVVPPGYGAALAAGRPAAVQLVLDGTDATTATTILGYAEGVVQHVNAERVRQGLALASLETVPGVEYRARVWYNPELRSTQFLVPGLTGFILMITAVVATSLSLVRERERGTLEQLRVTAIRPVELIVGKLAPYLVISLAASGVILLAARVVFGVKVRGSALDVFVATLLYLVGALAWGLLVSTVARSQAMAFQIGAVTSMMPAIFLSGFIFPIRSMPLAMQVVSYAVPARYYLVVLRGVILKGAGLGPYVDQLVYLALYAAVVTLLAALRMARQES